MERRYDPKYRHARVKKDEQGKWQIATCYDYLPLNTFITYEYRVDDFIPVVWDTLPASREEQENVAVDAANKFLNAKVATPFYYTRDQGEVYLLTEEGYERLICITPHLGDAGEIAYAMNQTFPQGDTHAYQEEQGRRNVVRTQHIIRQITEP